MEEEKRMSNFKWGQDFDRSYEENKKKFWKEVRRVKKGGSRTEETWNFYVKINFKIQTCLFI